MTEYQRTLDWLYALEAAKGMDFKLERIALALRRLGDPQRRLRCLHVGGTNGKGSVSAMLDAMLRAGGYRVGLYTSPHLVELGERIQVDGRPLSRATIIALADEVRAVSTAHGIDLTFFEFLTVMALRHFAAAGVDVAVLEVGLGGRLDATNVVDPLVAVITTIGLDHTQWLGETPAAIAAEKGGIIKPGRPIVLGRIGGEAAEVLHRLAGERGAPVIAAGRDYRVAQHGDGLDFEGIDTCLRDLRLALRGTYQRDNAATALAALAAVRQELPLAEAAIRRGLARVRWPGRLEMVPGPPPAVLDGAHNADGIEQLVAELPRLLGGRPLHLLFAVMGDKDWRAMVRRIAPHVRSAVVTEVLRPRGAAADTVASAFAGACPVIAEPDPARAWSAACQLAGRDGAVVAAGSLFLIGALQGLGVSAAGETRGAAHP
jgi:dihydrofolate synthase/folylpolyglutamate synthase